MIRAKDSWNEQKHSLNKQKKSSNEQKNNLMNIVQMKKTCFKWAKKYFK